MLLKQFRGKAKYLWIFLISVLILTVYREYRNRGEKESSAGFEVRKNKTKHRLIIVILSAPNNSEQRDAVRRTWLSEKYKNVKYYFAVGTLNADSNQKDLLTREETKNRDLLILPSLWDSYAALTKKLLQSFSRIYENHDFDFVLKCDDDSFVLVDRVLKELDKWELEANGKELYWGFFNGKAQVKKTGPWKETDWIFCDFYLPYALGGGYVLSHRLVQFIAQNLDILRIFNSEDISVGLWLAPLSNIERKHDVRFDTEYRSRGCSNEYIITHKQTAQSMNTIYETYKASGVLCLEEVRHRNSYEYNWNVPPSQCCIRQSGIP